MLVTTWVKSSVYKWVFIKVPAWAPYCSSWFWKPSPRSFIQDVPGKTCMQMTWSLSLKLLKELQEKLILWKTNMEGKGLRVNTGKTNVLISGLGLDVLQKSGKDPCDVYLKGIYTNTIFCGGCSSWIHKKCSGIPGCLKFDANFRCKRCTGQARPIDGRLMTKITVGWEKLELVPCFCYLGDCSSSGGKWNLSSNLIRLASPAT